MSSFAWNGLFLFIALLPFIIPLIPHIVDEVICYREKKGKMK